MIFDGLFSPFEGGDEVVEVFFELVDNYATRVVVRDGVGVEGKADEIGIGVC